MFVKSILALVWVVVVVVVAAVVDVAVVVWLRAGAASAGWLGVVGGAVNVQPHAGEARAASTVAAARNRKRAVAGNIEGLGDVDDDANDDDCCEVDDDGDWWSCDCPPLVRGPVSSSV